MWFIGLIIYSLICGFLSSLVGEAKGYPKKNWFWMGFWTGIFGLLAAAGMPNIYEQNENIKFLKDLEQAPKTFIYKVKQ